MNNLGYLRKCCITCCKSITKPSFNVVLPKWVRKRLTHYNFIRYKHNITSENLDDTSHIKQVLTINADEKYGINSFTYRTHTCGELRLKHDKQKVTLCGWVQYVRLSKFIILRDAYGIIQCVDNENTMNLTAIPLETVVRIDGIVTSRPKEMINQTIPTGEIEVIIKNLEILNKVETLPFNLRDYQKPKEQLRLQHRYVDLRFPEMQNNLRQRSSMLHNMRRFLIEKYNFIEVETPTLFCRTPGGAREFVVPTHYPGLFYSLVQSPQQFKQMLMSGGIDRYFQIARCYRDETTRPDRQPEFTQLDIEFSYTNRDGVLTLIENLLHETFLLKLPQPPFNRITYRYALENYGSDKPNLCYDLKLKCVTHLFDTKGKNSVFGVYALPYPKNLGKLSAKYTENIKVLKKKYNVNVITYERIVKEFGNDLFSRIQNEVGNDSSILALGDSDNVCLCLGEIRELIATLLKSKDMLVLNDQIEPMWVIDFPLFIKGENGLETCHHPFTAPHPDDIHLIDTKPLEVRSLAYDLVINGNEVGGGSVRVHNVDLQKNLLKILNIDIEKLTHFLNALGSGCPPHAGIALGIDRLVTIACNAESIRDVIAFPKSHEGKDPLSGAPNSISEDDKKYYHLCS